MFILFTINFCRVVQIVFFNDTSAIFIRMFFFRFACMLYDKIFLTNIPKHVRTYHIFLYVSRSAMAAHHKQQNCNKYTIQIHSLSLTCNNYIDKTNQISSKIAVIISPPANPVSFTFKTCLCIRRVESQQYITLHCYMYMYVLCAFETQNQKKALHVAREKTTYQR